MPLLAIIGFNPAPQVVSMLATSRRQSSADIDNVDLWYTSVKFSMLEMCFKSL